MLRRHSDRIRTWLLIGGAVVASVWPAMSAMAQTQDAINATVAQQMIGMAQRLDKIDAMINAVLIALVVNFIAQVVQINRGSGRRS